MIHRPWKFDYYTFVLEWDLHIWMCFSSCRVKAGIYLDVSFRVAEVSQALNGSRQVGAVFMQDLNYRVIWWNITEIISQERKIPFYIKSFFREVIIHLSCVVFILVQKKCRFSVKLYESWGKKTLKWSEAKLYSNQFHHKISYFIIILLDITSFRHSWTMALKDRITPMMVILFSTFSPPRGAYKGHRGVYSCAPAAFHAYSSTSRTSRQSMVYITVGKSVPNHGSSEHAIINYTRWTCETGTRMPLR